MADILRLIEPENVIRSADPENYILEPNINMKWIEWSVAEIWPF